MPRTVSVIALLLLALVVVLPVSAVQQGTTPTREGWTSPAIPLNTLYPIPTNSITVIQNLPGYAVVGAEHQYMRTGDGIEYAANAIVNWGTPLIVLGRNDDTLPDNSDDLWWYVEVGGMRGWMKGTLLVLRGDLTDVPVVPVYGELNPARLYLAFDNSPIYSTPALTTRLCTLPGHLEYEVVGRNRDSSRFQLEATCDGRTVLGWIHADRGIFRNPGDIAVPITG